MLIRADRHGLYVRTGGYLFRPVPTAQTNGPLRVNRRIFVIGTPSRYIDGEKVPGRHIAGTGRARVGEEYWASHGTSEHFADGHARWTDSEQLFEPKPERLAAVPR